MKLLHLLQVEAVEQELQKHLLPADELIDHDRSFDQEQEPRVRQ